MKVFWHVWLLCGAMWSGSLGCTSAQADWRAIRQRAHEVPTEKLASLCERDVAPACVHEAGRHKDASRHRSLYRRACEMGDLAGCTQFGSVRMGDVFRDLRHNTFDPPPELTSEQYAAARDAAAALEPACHAKGEDLKVFVQEWGEVMRGVACSNLGTLFEHGLARGPDLERALELHKQGCELGWVGGCSHTGRMYSIGAGTDKDIQEATTYLRRACRAGDTYGCDLLGDIDR